MELTGLIHKYPVNRWPNYAEDRGRLKPAERLEIDPCHFRSILRLNSTYLETVGKFYDWRGFFGAMMIACALVGTFGCFVGFYGAFGAAFSRDDRWAAPVILFLLCILILMMAFVYWALYREIVRLTHYPIRFNRKLRKFYAFDAQTLDVVEADWDKLYLTIQPARKPFGAVKQWEILAHILDDAGKLIVRTIPFSGMWGAKEDVLRHWEYIRRYMEEGPESVFDGTPVCLDIVDKKEKPLFGFLVLLTPFSSPILMIPGGIMMFFAAIARCIGMQFSKIPQWPARIEAECAIDAGDPWELDARHNPANFWAATTKTRSQLVAEGLVKR